MLGNIRRKLKDNIYQFWGAYSHLSSEAYVSELESRGCQVGEGTRFFGEKNVDLKYAYLINIGRNCVITDQVRILSHSRDDLILNRAFDDAPEQRKWGTVDIGDNVFIGERSIVLPDVEIGNNVIVGAGSVISSDIPSDSVAAGVPCEVKSTLEEHKNRRVSAEPSDIRGAIDRCKENGVQVPDELVGYEG